MNRKSADYLAAAKVALGNASMSDRELGVKLGGFSQPMIGKAKAGNMSDPLALALSAVLPDVDAGEILWVARMERENDPAVKSALEAYVGKIMAAMPKKTAEPEALGGMVAQAPSPEGSQGRLCIM